MPHTLLEHRALSTGDWSIVLIYIVLMVGTALWARRGKVDREDYFVAGRSMNWLIISLAIFASMFSTLSFVSIPGESYGNGLMFSLMGFGAFIFIQLSIWLFLKFFFQHKSFTAYEYLERRFNLPVRLIGAGIFTVLRLTYIGTILYSAAEIFKSLVGWDSLTTVCILGGFTVLYTTIVGIRTLIWADIVGSVIVFVGVAAIMAKLVMATGFNFTGVYKYAAIHDHGFEPLFAAKFYKLDLYNRLNFWLMLLNIVIGPLACLSCDQLYVQRLLSSKGYKHAVRAVWGNNLLGLPVLIMLWFIGIALYYYYGRNPGKLPLGMGSDQVLGFFINTELISPLPGIVITSLIACVVSTINSVVNSLATVIYCDGLLRLDIVKAGNPNEMFQCRLMSIIAGIVGVGFALFLIFAGQGIKSSVFEVTGIWAALWGVLLMAFILGVCATRVSGGAMVAGLVTGGAVSLVLPYILYYTVPAQNRISFMWMGFPGEIIAFGLPLVLSIFYPMRKKPTNLTLWTLEEPAQTAGIVVEPVAQGGAAK